jgi:hypothetical protein
MAWVERIERSVVVLETTGLPLTDTHMEPLKGLAPSLTNLPSSCITVYATAAWYQSQESNLNERRMRPLHYHCATLACHAYDVYSGCGVPHSMINRAVGNSPLRGLPCDFQQECRVAGGTSLVFPSQGICLQGVGGSCDGASLHQTPSDWGLSCFPCLLPNHGSPYCRLPT